MTYPETEFYRQKCAVKREGYRLKNPASLIPMRSFIVKNPFKHYTSASLWRCEPYGIDFFALILNLNFCILPHNRCFLRANFVHILSNTLFKTLSSIPDAVAALRIKEKECLSLGRAFFNVQY